MNGRKLYGLLLYSLSALSLCASPINLGRYSGTSITGFPPGIVNGTIHQTDAVARNAQADALTAYNYLAGLAPTMNLSGTDLGGLTLTPGVYKFDSMYNRW